MRELRNGAADISSFELIGKLTIYSFLSILLLMLIFAIITNNRGKCLYALWQNISFITLIHWIPLIDIDDYSEFESFFNEISIIFRPYQLPEICSDEVIDIRKYKVMRINSNGFINNSKEILLVYLLTLFSFIGIIIASKHSKSELIQRLKLEIKYSAIIRLHLILFLDFMTFSMINLYFYTGNHACSSVNLGLSLFFLITGAVWILLIPIVIKVKSTSDITSHHDIVFQGIITITQEFKHTFDTTKYQYYTIYLLYRYSLAFCLVILPDSPTVQLFIIAIFQMIICKVYIVGYILFARPFAYKSDSITVFISELLSLLLIVFVGIRSMNSLGVNTKYIVSVCCIVLIWLNEIVITARYIIRIINYQKNSLESVASESQNPATTVVEITGSQIRVEHNMKDSAISIDQFEESNDNDNPIETHFPMDPYKYMHNNTVNDAVTLKNEAKSMKSDSAYASYINTSSIYGQRDHRNNLVEELKMRDFLERVNHIEFKAGNMGLGFK